MKGLLMLLGALSTLGCAATSARQPALNAASAADQEAAIAAVQALFDAMRARDTSAIRAVFTPDAQLVSIRTVPGAPARFQTQPLAAFVTSVGRAPEELVERMWDPRVEIAGDLASLWAPYEFRIGANFSHCGHDAVHLVRTAEGWKIAGIAYTVITTGCAVS
ncbi:MAG: nuclear transport factor 2 family protein [Gemmatimonadaceae bacterium]